MKRLFLPVILLLALFLRVLWLDSYPAGFTPDEASFGYDAYSIVKTGKDQWGKPYPLVLESFGDFKSPLNAYLAVPSIAIFGLSKFSVRLPNAILGSLAVLVVYFLTRELLKSKKVALVAALLLAISPWHVQLSRGAFEANLATLFLPLAVLLFLNKRFAASGVVFGLNLFSYHSAKLVTPLLFIATIIYAGYDLKKSWRGIAVFGLFFVLNFYTFSLGAGARAAERSIAQGALEAAFSERIHSSTFFHNKYFVVVDRFFSNYLTYFSPQFLFSSGPAEGTYGMIPGRGVLFWFTIPFFIGLRKVYYSGKSESKREISFLLFWALIAVIPAAMATGVGYHANRVASMMPAIDIALAIGAVEFLSWLKNKKLLLYSLYSLVLIFFIFFLEDYFIQSPYKIAKSMLYGNLEAAQWVSKNIPPERGVAVSKSLSEPHIYFAFASKLAPLDYQEESKSWDYKAFGVSWVDQIPSYRLGRFTFTNIKDYKGTEILVGRTDEFPSGVTPLKTIYYPDGEPAILIVDPTAQIYAKAT